MALSLVLRVGDTSAQDVALTSSGVVVLDYPMQPPNIDQQALNHLGDGNGLSVPSWSNVTESIEIHISAATALLVSDKIRAIEKLLDLARQGTTGMLDDRLYLLAQFDQDTEAWRSQILAARWEPAAITKQIWKKYAVGTLIITRRFYWETEAIKSIEISSGVTTTPTTGYAAVYNADSTHSTNRNWFHIAAAQVQGSIPAPARIYIKNASAGARAVGSIYIGNYVFSGIGTVNPIFRGEDAAGSDTTPDTTETNMYYWSLADGNLTDSFKGQFGRIITVFSDRPEPTTLLRAALQYRGPSPVLDLALGEQVLSPAADFVVDLGGIPIPPGGYFTSSGGNLYLVVKGKTQSGTDTVAVDWVQVFPSGAGRYRVIKGITALSVGIGDEIVDDGPEGAIYGISSGARVPLFRPLFEPIYLWPGRNQLARMVISGGTSFEAAQLWNVKMETRYRRITV